MAAKSLGVRVVGESDHVDWVVTAVQKDAAVAGWYVGLEEFAGASAVLGVFVGGTETHRTRWPGIDHVRQMPPDAALLFVECSAPSGIGRISGVPVWEWDAAGETPGWIQRDIAGWLENASLRAQVAFHVVAQEFEALLHRLDRALDENHHLREQLERADIEVDFLRRQVASQTEMLRAAQRANNRGLLRTAIVGLGGVMLAVVSGAAGGAGEVVTTHLIEGPAVAQRSGDVALDYSIECENLVVRLQAPSTSDEPPPGPEGPGPDATTAR